jgi:hypothetical protein
MLIKDLLLEILDNLFSLSTCSYSDNLTFKVIPPVNWFVGIPNNTLRVNQN